MEKNKSLIALISDERNIKLKRIFSGVILFLICGYFIYYFYPSDQSEKFEVSGQIHSHKTGGKNSVSSFRIEDVIFSCSLDPFAAVGICPNLEANKGVKAIYFYHKTLVTTFFDSKGVPVLMRLEKKGEILYNTSFQELLNSYYQSCIKYVCFFAFIYFLIAKFIS